MKFKNIVTFTKYFTIMLAFIVSTFSCQEETIEIINPKPSDIIETDSELTSLLNRIVSESTNENIDYIEFQYPISYATFNTVFDVIETKTINSNTDFFIFLETLNEDLISTLNYPISFLAEDTTFTANTNEELQTAIENTIDIHETNIKILVGNCSQNSITENLTNCTWNISYYATNPEYEEYTYTFSSNNLVTLSNNNTTYTGTWEVFENDENLILNITNELMSFTWPIVECGDDFIQASGNNDTIIINKNCNEVPVMVQNCTQTSITENLIDCNWAITRYSENDQYEDYYFTFNQNTTLSLFNNTGIENTGDWEVFENDNKLFLNITTELINLTWQIVECEDDYIQANDDNETIIISKKCSTAEEEEAKELLINCSWYIDYYNADGENLFSDHSNDIFKFSEDDTFIFNDATTSYHGNWTIETDDESNLILILTPTTPLPEHINYNYTITTLRDSFTEWSANDTQQNIMVGFEKDCN